MMESWIKMFFTFGVILIISLAFVSAMTVIGLVIYITANDVKKIIQKGQERWKNRRRH